MSYRYQGSQPHAATHLNGLGHYTYDDGGNLVQRTVPQDDLLVYDAENRLVEVQRLGQGGVRTVLVRFRYDGDGNRVQMTEYTEGFAGVTEETTTYIGSHLEMRQSIWNERLTPASFTTHYYAGNRHLAVYPDTDKPMWLLGDHLGSATLVPDLEGFVHSFTRYKPWGETVYAWGSSLSRHGFTDQRRDTSTALYYYHARYYDPVLGRFTQPDTIVPDATNPQDWNRYSYVRNNPVLYTDPTGHWHDDIAGMNVGGRGGATSISAGGSSGAGRVVPITIALAAQAELHTPRGRQAVAAAEEIVVQTVRDVQHAMSSTTSQGDTDAWTTGGEEASFDDELEDDGVPYHSYPSIKSQFYVSFIGVIDTDERN